MKLTGKITIRFYFLITAIVLNIFPVKASFPFQDVNLPVDQRVTDLISQMTLAEKLAQLGNQAPAIGRLGIPAYNYWNEALHGVGRSGLATSFPQAIALSSTWDPELIYNVASVISDEARVKNNTEGKGLTYWSPTINMARDPRWGRAEENYGEDPYLTSQIAVNFVKGMQGNDPKYLKTVATAKHFACNNIEVNRYGISSTVDERSLREYFLPAFKACVTEGKVFSIMSAYNALNGVPCPANRTLLTQILRNEWGFKGYVVSDCDAVSNVWDAHHYVTTATEATAISLRNGTDLNCGTTFPVNANTAIQNGLMSEEDVNIALKRVFKARFLLGEFDPPAMVPYTSISKTKLDSPENRALALKAAHEAIVLLKNQHLILPLNKDSIHSIAVIGPNADVIQLGGYSGSPAVMVTPLQGIKAKLGIDALDGKTEAESYNNHFGIQVESCAEGGSDLGFIENGDYTEYDNVNFGTGMTKFDVRVASFNVGGNLNVYLDSMTGKLLGTIAVKGTSGWQNWVTQTMDIEKTSGIHNVYLKFTGGSGYLFNVNWFKIYDPNAPVPVASKTVQYAIGCSIKGALNQADIDAAVKIAKSSDVAVVVCGTDLSVADEGADRTSLNLPGAQEQLIQAVYKANPKTIVVLVTGFSLAVNWAQDNVPAILTAWYDGQAQGSAIADVLFGDYNPGGKLSTTWYKSVSDLPSINDYDIKHNRTYMYFKEIPLYPFGYGLSYTTFTYSNLKLGSVSINPGDSMMVSTDVTNSGKLPSDEVVQLYAHVQSSAIIRPIKELKAFQRITLQPGETKTVSLKLKHTALSYYDENDKVFRVESGKVDLFIGSSSSDIRLDGVIEVSGGIVASTYRQDPVAVTQAENFENNSSSVKVTSCAEGGQSIDFAGNKSYAVYKNFNFTGDEKQFNARLSTLNNNGGVLQVVLDSLNGAQAGALTIKPIADLKTYNTQSVELTSIFGVRDVYLIYNTSSTSVLKLNWFSFQNSVGPVSTTILMDEKYKVTIFPNPTDMQTILKYDLPEFANVLIEIYSQQGTLVKSMPQSLQAEGSYQLKIDTSLMKSGTYLVRFSTKAYSKSLLVNVLN